MDETAQPEKIASRCPHCNTAYRIDVARVGEKVRCKHCSQAFEVSPIEAALPREGAADNAGNRACPVCQCPIRQDDAKMACPSCGASYHRDCWEYNGGCGVYGCCEVPPTEQLGSIEIPAAYWGQDNKACPTCGQMILAAAVRCRHCGAEFASAQPVDASTFWAHSEAKRQAPAVQRTGVWLLILGVLPCTAPLVAVFGSMWYARHRESIGTLPPLHSAICKMGVGAAIGQTVLLIVVTLLYGLLQG